MHNIKFIYPKSSSARGCRGGHWVRSVAVNYSDDSRFNHLKGFKLYHLFQSIMD